MTLSYNKSEEQAMLLHTQFPTYISLCLIMKAVRFCVK